MELLTLKTKSNLSSSHQFKELRIQSQERGTLWSSQRNNTWQRRRRRPKLNLILEARAVKASFQGKPMLKSPLSNWNLRHHQRTWQKTLMTSWVWIKTQLQNSLSLHQAWMLISQGRPCRGIPQHPMSPTNPVTLPSWRRRSSQQISRLTSIWSKTRIEYVEGMLQRPS